MKLHRKDDFNPSISHPYYFVRKYLYKGIANFSANIYGKILDFGCGRKPYKHLFNYTEYIGIDYENEGHPHDEEVIDVFYNGKNIPFDDNFFDSIISTEVFEHIFNLEELLTELNRVLKPKGKMLITCPFVWNEHEVPHDFARYTQYALKEMLEKNNFSILQFKKSGNFISVIFQLLNLYFFRKIGGKVKKFLVTKFIYNYFFVSVINLLGLLFIKLLPNDDSLYLNNVLLIQKKN